MFCFIIFSGPSKTFNNVCFPAVTVPFLVSLTSCLTRFYSVSQTFPSAHTNVINEAWPVSMLDHLKGSDTTASIEGETLAPARHTFRMDSFSNPHCTTKSGKKTQRFTHWHEGSDTHTMLVITRVPRYKKTPVVSYKCIRSHHKYLLE